MKRFITSLILLLTMVSFHAEAQERETGVWTLQDCLNYALENNIQIKKSKITQMSGEEDVKRAKAQLFPSLNASLSQGFVNYPSGKTETNNSFSGNYGLNANWTLFDGGSRLKSIKQQEIQQQVNELSVEQNEDDIQISIVQTYLQVIYCYEAVGINEKTVEVSKQQLERSAGLLDAGSISQVDYAQMESQYNSDKYQLVVAKNNLESYKLQLKQLLELDITDDMELVMIEPDEEAVLSLLPDKQSIYANAISQRADIRSSKLSLDIAELEIKKAQSGYLPSLSLSAGIGTGYLSGGLSWGDQVWNRLNESVSLSLSIPIFTNRENKTAVNKARYSLKTTELDMLNTEKSLLKTVEGIYLDAVSAQSQYIASKERLKYVEESYKLVQEQFELGMKNTLELITEKNNFQIAQQETIQSKYTAVMNLQLLNIYQKLPITIQ